MDELDRLIEAALYAPASPENEARWEAMLAEVLRVMERGQ